LRVGKSKTTLKGLGGGRDIGFGAINEGGKKALHGYLDSKKLPSKIFIAVFFSLQLKDCLFPGLIRR